MLLLALDTCDSRGSIALLRDEDVLQVEVHDTCEDYSSWLLPAADRLLRAAGLSHPDISVYAVAAGPGSFTGVRVGLTTVKAWAEAYGRPVAGVSRLQALVSHSLGHTPFVAAFTDAHRNQVFACLYDRLQGTLRGVAEEQVTSPIQFVDWVIQTAGAKRVEWVSPDPKCITTTDPWASRLSLGETIHVIAPVLAPAVGRLGFREAQKDRLETALSLDANYVRRSDAELFWKGASGGR